MRILQLIHQFLPKNVAGSEVYTFQLSSELVRQGHDVTVLFAEIDPSRPSFETDSSSYRGISTVRMVYNYQPADFRETYCSSQAEEVFDGVMRKLGPDVVHLQQLQSFSLGIPAIASRRAAVVFTLHEYGLLCPLWGQMFKTDRSVCDRPSEQECTDCLGGSGFFGPLLSEEGVGSVSERRAMVDAMVPYVDRFVAPSKFLRDRFVGAGFPAERVVYSDYGFPPIPAMDSVRDDGPPRFAYVGTLVPHKGIHVLLEAFSTLPKELAFELRVYGDPEKAPDYVGGLKGAWKDDRIRWMGEFDPAERGSVYRGVDCLVVPSIWYENSPLTIHEAFQFGIPLLTSDFGGMAELVRDGGGQTFEMGSAQDLRRVVEEILRDQVRLSDLAQSIPLVKTVAQNASEMATLYKEALGTRIKPGWFQGVLRRFRRRTSGE